MLTERHQSAPLDNLWGFLSLFVWVVCFFLSLLAWHFSLCSAHLNRKRDITWSQSGTRFAKFFYFLLSCMKQLYSNKRLWVFKQTQSLSADWTSVYKDINLPWIPVFDGHLSPCWSAPPGTYSAFLLRFVYREGFKLPALCVLSL